MVDPTPTTVFWRHHCLFPSLPSITAAAIQRYHGRASPLPIPLTVPRRHYLSISATVTAIKAKLSYPVIIRITVALNGPTTVKQFRLSESTPMLLFISTGAINGRRLSESPHLQSPVWYIRQLRYAVRSSFTWRRVSMVTWKIFVGINWPNMWLNAAIFTYNMSHPRSSTKKAWIRTKPRKMLRCTARLVRSNVHVHTPGLFHRASELLSRIAADLTAYKDYVSRLDAGREMWREIIVLI